MALLLASLGGFAVARYSGSFAGQAGVIFLAVGFLACLFSFFQMRLEENERLERLDLEELARKSKDSALFRSNEAELFPARRALEQFERYLLPAFSLLLLAVQAGGAWWLWYWLTKSYPLVQQGQGTSIQEPVVALCLWGLGFLVLFLLGRFASSIARLEKQRLLRPGAAYLLLSAYLCAVVALGVLLVYVGFLKADFYLAYGLAVVLALMAAENLVGLLLEVYRPRVKGQEARLLYDSRLVGLLGQPEGIFTTAAHALDYQFGFKVSETWFYQFLRQYLGWFLLVQVLLLWLSTSVVIIDAGEQAILERFGKPVTSSAIMEPGPHFKLPWPMDIVYRHQTRRIQSFQVGFTAGAHDEDEKAILWSVPHYEEELNMLVASREQNVSSTPGTEDTQAVPVNLLTVNIPVQYQITNLLAWATNYTDAGALLEKVATREVVRYLVSVDINDIMTAGREKAAVDLLARIQARANEMQFGVHIIFVGLQGIHPPVKIASAYEAVVAAEQEKEAKILRAQGYQARTVPMAKAESIRLTREAEAYRERTKAGAAATAAQFDNKIIAYKASTNVFTQRAYMQAMAKGLANARKYVIATTNTDDVVILNLEDKVRADLLDVPLPPAKK